jgi:hypothetical protein
MADVNKFKAKIVNLHSVRMEETKVDLDHLAVFNNERASIYHIIKQTKCKEQRTITKILDQAGRKQTTEKRIVHVFQDFLRNKFEPIRVDTECVRRMVEAGHGIMMEVGKETVDRPPELEELRVVLRKGGIKPMGRMALAGHSFLRYGRS